MRSVSTGSIERATLATLYSKVDYEVRECLKGEEQDKWRANDEPHKTRAADRQ